MSSTANGEALSRRSRLFQLTIIGVLAIHILLLAFGAYVHSPTLDEPAHLASGIYHWKYLQFECYRVNPPLVRMVAALPSLVAGAECSIKGISLSPYSRPEFALGNRFMEKNQRRGCWLIILGRWVCIPFSVLGALIIYRWARESFGRAAAMMGLVLWCFEPNVIGHGQLLTPDVPAAALAIAAAYAFLCWLKKPTIKRAIASGIVLGMAQLTRTTLVFLFPAWIIVWIAYRALAWKKGGAIDFKRDLGMVALQLFIAVYLINAGYAFQGTLIQLGKFPFVSDLFTGRVASEAVGLDTTYSDEVIPDNRFKNSWLGRIPVPLPEDYLRGIDEQRRDFEHLGRPSYLHGQWSDHGWWYYYLYALAIKLPVGILILLIVSIFLIPSNSVNFGEKAVILVPAMILFVVVSSQTGFSHHMRYVLVVFPFMCLWLSQLANLMSARRRKLTIVLVICVTSTVVSSLWTYPHSLSYFNEIVGGPANGMDHLLHSNLDWGQDLFYVKRWVTKHPEASKLGLAYYGSINPKSINLDFYFPRKLDAYKESGEEHQPFDRYFAISANLLKGYPCTASAPDGSREWCEMNHFSCFEDYQPFERIGYSMFIYRIPNR